MPLALIEPKTRKKRQNGASESTKTQILHETYCKSNVKAKADKLPE